MNIVKHTPGPWIVPDEKLDRDVTIYTRIQESGNPLYIARVYGQGTFGPQRPETKANARLIAAAPELLELARAVSKLTNQYGSGNLGWLNNKANELIAKAEGRE